MYRLLPVFVAICAVLSGCATPSPSPLASVQMDRIAGVWRLPDEQGWIELGPCPENTAMLCGALIGFDGDPDARDFNHPDFWSWGERLCGSAILQSASYEAEADLWRGHVYWRADGQVLDAELVQTGDDTLEVVLFEGADLDEGVSMAVSALLGGPPDPVDLTYFSFRAVAGREVLSQPQTWSRAATPSRFLCPR